MLLPLVKPFTLNGLTAAAIAPLTLSTSTLAPIVVTVPDKVSTSSATSEIAVELPLTAAWSVINSEVSTLLEIAVSKAPILTAWSATSFARPDSAFPITDVNAATSSDKSAGIFKSAFNESRFKPILLSAVMLIYESFAV